MGNWSTAVYDVATHQKTQQGLKPPTTRAAGIYRCGRNASENPAGIETMISERFKEITQVATHQKTQQGLKLS